MACRLILDNEGEYNPGDQVCGRVVCDFNSKQTFRAIRVKFRGREHTKWTEKEIYHNMCTETLEKGKIYYEGDNKFLAVNIDLVGQSSVSSGHYEYPFKFIIPQNNIPNPYSGSNGYIKYYIKATIEIPFNFDYEDVVPLRLRAPINFNDIQDQLQLGPVAYQNEKTVCCCCFFSGPIIMNLFLEKEAYVLEEVAKIKVEVNNMSNTSLSKLILALKMKIKLTATTPGKKSKTEKYLLAKAHDTGVEAHSQRSYEFNFKIATDTIIPNFQGSTLFTQKCILSAVGVVPGLRSNLKIKTGVVLGHIPVELTIPILEGPSPQPPPVDTREQVNS